MSHLTTNSQPSYTPSDVANILGMKKSSIYALISRGYLPANRVGTRRIITGSQLNHYLLNRGSTDHIIDLTLQPTLWSGVKTLQGIENQMLLIDSSNSERKWPNETK